jgi:chromosome segregation ATPase
MIKGERKLQARLEGGKALVEQHRVELARIEEDLEGISPDTEDLEAIVALQERAKALRYLLEAAEEEVKGQAYEVDQVSQRLKSLQTRVGRLRSGLESLEDETRSLPYSPAERREKLAELRYKLAILTGDPQAAESQLEAVEAVITDSQRRADQRRALAAWAREIRSLVKLPEE